MSECLGLRAERGGNMTKKSISFQPRGRWVYGGMEKGRRDYLGNTPTKKIPWKKYLFNTTVANFQAKKGRSLADWIRSSH